MKPIVKPTFQRAPFEVVTDASIGRKLEQAITAHLGHKPAHTGQTSWTDASLLADAGMETLLLDPSDLGLPSAGEWIDVQSGLD